MDSNMDGKEIVNKMQEALRKEIPVIIYNLSCSIKI